MSATLPLFETQPQSAQQSLRNGNHRIPEVALNILRDLSLPDAVIGESTLALPQMDPKLYTKVASVLEACGIQWNRKRKTHVLSPDSLQELRAAVESGIYYDSARALEFFATAKETARDLALMLADKLRDEDAPIVLEPSAGEGALICALLEVMPNARVVGVELDPRRARTLAERFAGDPRVTIHQGDILTFSHAGFDGVIMNPPFEASLSHVMHTFSLLKPTGTLVGIAMTTRKKDRDMALFLQQRGALVWPTEDKAFVGTTVNATCFRILNDRSLYDSLRARLEQEHPTIGAPTIQRLCEISRDVHTAMEQRCDEKLTGERAEERIEALRSEAQSLVAHENIEIMLAHTPLAGHGLRLGLPSGYSNDGGRTGMIVPRALPDATEE